MIQGSRQPRSAKEGLSTLEHPPTVEGGCHGRGQGGRFSPIRWAILAKDEFLSGGLLRSARFRIKTTPATAATTTTASPA